MTDSGVEKLLDKEMDYKEWSGMDQMESMCMVCGKNGVTRFLLHKIPYFRELIIASFCCEECGERNNEVTFGGEIQLQGCIYELEVTTPEDLNRQLIKSDSASVKIRELEFEIPPMTQKGEISTIEGVIRTAAKNLSIHQPERMIQAPEVGARVAQIIAKLHMYANGFDEIFPFHISVDDPAGNSFLENPLAPKLDPKMKKHNYFRTPQQDEMLGLQGGKGIFRDDKESNINAFFTDGGKFGLKKDPLSTGTGDSPAPVEVEKPDGGGVEAVLGRSEVITIPSNCPNCQFLGESRTAITDIPHFKEMLIMAFDCATCGFRTNEIKGGGAVPTLGTEVEIRVENEEDLKRDLLKSDSAMVTIHELDLVLQYGTLGGLFTSVEGLMKKIRKNLFENHPFAVGDSSSNESRIKFDTFLHELEEYAEGRKFPFTLTLRDPLGNSFISSRLNLSTPPELDPCLKITDFERTYDENEEFGLNDMNTKDFEVVDTPSASGPILSDRLTRRHVQGPDHPTPFAMGTTVGDKTQGGVYFPPTVKKLEIVEEEEKGEYCPPPAGWSAEKHAADESDLTIPETELFIPKRQFSDDSGLLFEAREEFGGFREGFVFKLGSQGLGYYEDKAKKQFEES